ncbi:MAG: GGDEF domain-containing protein [Candidatus Izemoplasmataceae bacterium]
MIIKLIITYQILIINLVLTHILAKKKYSNLVTFGILFLFTVVLSVILFYTSTLFSGEKPTAWFILTGAFYIAPLSFLFSNRFKELITIMIYCWTYTMTISSISVGIGYFINIFSQNMNILIIQTILFTISFYLILTFTRNKFMVVINSASNATRNSLILLGMSMFGTIVGIRYFISPQEEIYYVLVFLLIIIVSTSYNLLFRNVQSNINLDSAKKIVYQDTLTGIANRYSLFQDIKILIAKNQEFKLLFLDLDDLKLVNDTLGHQKGDDYLKHFANILVQRIQNKGTSYRFAGDEFVCVIPQDINMIDVSKFEKEINIEMAKHFKFNGVSIGISDFPKDGLDLDTLLQVADNNMYGVKNSKKIRSSQTNKN